MSSLYSGIIPIIKKAAVDAVNSTQPVQFVFGTVTSVSPTKVQVTPKLTLGAGNLVIAGRLSGSNSLEKGDSVILARMQGGNKYIVLDKAVNVE